jgi:ATP-dependent RNA helicase DDX5/DBP2
MVPTRELALQIFQEAEKFAYIRENVLARTAVVYGGAGRGIQMEKLSLGPQLLIATPGRLLDFLEMGVTNLRRVSHVVLDEADRMLEIGMEDQLRKIIDQIRPDRQTTMYSATWPTTVQQLALDYLKNPIQVNVGHTGLKVPQTITQVIDVCDPLERNHKLVHLLKNSTQTDKILVFTKTKQTCDELAMLLRDYGHMPVALHGDKSQTVRESALRSFKQGHSSIMIATDVAARGLDIRNVTYVVNYDFPDTVENYVHRIGRTGRAGAEGIAYSFLTSSHFHLAPNLAKLLKEAGQEMDERLQQICNARAATVRDSYSSRPNYRQTSRPMFRSSPPPFKRQSQVRLFH